MIEKVWSLKTPRGVREKGQKRDKDAWLDLLLQQRGLWDPREREAFLQAQWENLSSPFSLLNMGAALDRLHQALKNKETLCIYGDYDVDGMSSVALLRKTFHTLGHEALYYIPDRLKEGYGMNADALSRLQDRGVDLVVTVDNGIGAGDLIASFPDMDFLITDHHEITQGLPDAIVVNPQLDHDPHLPSRHLCGAGVAFFLARALLSSVLGEEAEPHIRTILPYAALATVADVVPLKGDNRILVKEGLAELNARPRPFVQALWPSWAEGKPLEASHIGFQIGPRLNACGRLGRPDIGVSLLESQSLQEAQTYAQIANRLNDDRKAMEGAIYKSAKSQRNPAEPGLLAVGKGWHEGVIGIVASRLVEDSHLPAAVCALGEDGGLTCSARSIPGISLADILTGLSQYLTSFGGHAMAAGFRLDHDHLPAFKKAFMQACRQALEECDPLPTYDVDAVLSPEEISFDLYEAIQAMAPFGEGNPEPLFVIERAEMVSCRRVGQEANHLSLQVAQGQEERLKGIYFRYPEEKEVPKGRVDLVAQIIRNRFGGRDCLEVQVHDMRASWKGPDPRLNNLLFSQRTGEGHKPYRLADAPNPGGTLTLYPGQEEARRAFWEEKTPAKGLLLPSLPQETQAQICDLFGQGLIRKLLTTESLARNLPQNPPWDPIRHADKAPGRPLIPLPPGVQAGEQKEALARVLSQSMEKSGWTLVYVDQEEEKRALMKALRAQRTLYQRDRVLALSPWPPEDHFQILDKTMAARGGGVFIASHLTPLPCHRFSFAQGVFLDLPRSYGALSHLLDLLGPDPHWHALWTPEALSRHEETLYREYPNRNLLGLVYRSLAHLAGPGSPPLPWTQDLPARLSRLSKQEVTPLLLEAACRIFLEIKVLDIAKDGDVRYIRFIKQKEKQDLNDSPSYKEGKYQVKAYRKLTDLLS